MFTDDHPLWVSIAYGAVGRSSFLFRIGSDIFLRTVGRLRDKIRCSSRTGCKLAKKISECCAGLFNENFRRRFQTLAHPKSRTCTLAPRALSSPCQIGALIARLTSMLRKELTLITGNKGKLAEAQAILNDLVGLKSRSLELTEVQGTITEITSDKCRRAAAIV